MKRSAAEAGLGGSIKQAPAGTSGQGPWVVHFPSGFNPEGDVACEWESYAHSERRNQHVLVARGASDDVDFVGSTSSADYSSALPCRYALGLFSRSAGRLQVMPAEGGKVLRMEPRVRGLNYAPRGTTTVIEAGQLRDANMRLVEEFGSQRRKRQLKAREAGKVEAHHVSGAGAVLGIISTAGAASPLSKAEVIASSLAHRNIPPHHPEATTGEGAYRSDELLPPAVADGLEITKLFPAENKEEYRETLRESGMFGESYVFSRLPLLRSAGSKGEREERCRMLCLLGHLLKLQGPKWGVVKGGRGGFEEMGEKLKMAPSVLEGLLDLFYTEEAGDFAGASKWLLSKDKRSLMLGWILVLAIRVEPGNVLEAEQLQALADELKQRPLELVARYRELGCADSATSAVNEEGGRTRGYRVSLMPPSAEEKTLGDYFPALKLGAKRR